jgi:hypothetical protein
MNVAHFLQNISFQGVDVQSQAGVVHQVAKRGIS